MNFTYLAYLAFTLLGTFLVLREGNVSFSPAKKNALFRALMVTAIVFIWWDVIAVWRGHWSFDPAFTIGIWIGNQPIEEMLFFFVMPFFGIAVWEVLAKRERKGKSA